jgi:HEAT repeat protein
MVNQENNKLPLSEFDLSSLVKALRTPGNAGLRARAARALGEKGDYQAVESLVRASLEDPDSDVQAAANGALAQLLGSQAGDAIAAYRAGPPAADPWIEPLLAGDLLKDTLDAAGREDIWGTAPAAAPGETRWNIEDVDGLLSVLKSNDSQDVRLRAIQALKNIEDTRVVDVLISIAKRGEGKAVRQAAEDALEDLVGENLSEVLPDDQENEYDEDDEEEDDQGNEEDEESFGEEEEEPTAEDGESEDDLSSEYQFQDSETDFPASPVIQEERPSGLTFLAVLLVLAAIGLVLYLVLR